MSLRESKRGSLSLDVDHVVAVKLWETLATPPDDAAVAAAPMALVIDDPSTAMNSLGNCCLLEKSFNIAKGSQPLRAFLDCVHEFKNGSWTVDKWTESLGIDAELVDPTGKAASEVRTAVEQRTAKMKEDLKKYISGEQQRRDI